MHRLLLGVSHNGGNVLPWCHLLGACRHIDPSGPPPNGAAAGVGPEGSSLALAAGAGGGPPGSGAGGPGAGEGLDASSDNISPQRARLNGIAGGGPSGGGGAGGGAVRRSAVMSVLCPPGPPDIREQHAWLHGLLTRPDAAAALSRWLSEEAVEAVGQMANHSIDHHSIACLLLGTFSVAGADVVPYKSLAGILASRYRHTAADIGGSITEALELAALSTRDRVERLQQMNRELHKQANKLRRNLSDQRKVERESRAAEARSATRKVAGRPLSPLHAFVLQKRPDVFVGLGIGEDIPVALQAEGKLYNRMMEKAEAERLVHAVWAAKREFESSHAVRITLSDYLSVHMQRKYGATRPAVEGAYNLVYTLGQHQYDPDCYLFFKILTGDLDECTRDGQERLRSAVQTCLLAADAAANSGRVTGWLRKSDIRDAVTRLLGARLVARRWAPGRRAVVLPLGAAQLSDLFDALDDETSHEMVAYARLFEDDTDLSQGIFVETLRQQHLHSRLDWLQAIEDAVLDWAEAGGSPVVGPTALRNAILRATPDGDPAIQRELLVRVFGNAGASVVLPYGEKPSRASRASKVSKEETNIALPLEVALRRLRQERMEGCVGVAAAMELVAAGRSMRGSRSATSPRRTLGTTGDGAEGAGASQSSVAGPAGSRDGEKGAGVVWADGEVSGAPPATPPRVGFVGAEPSTGDL
ncbi:hypothetical protein GPECTOR_8g293 [Gonium pectorale]|uniref:Uncharacterized protein n=1 Tax=Gonium pectorale TaxID=33097 RepID=A0A150GST5_GONPE|nr:hypothetical protein GPECTOR_8g293 [Gonium pectorale]|eukprot:KXZ52915.1 hypothetical protein GPECTOR_8g293 [Gonium pectorale]